MSIIFINREEELGILENAYSEQGSNFVVIFGRRRVGKTELVKRFVKGKHAVYYLADMTNHELQLKKINLLTSDVLGERPYLINDWEDFFKFFREFQMSFLIHLQKRFLKKPQCVFYPVPHYF